LDLMSAEGVNFIPNANVGVDTDVETIQRENDALVLATGATWPRDPKIPGRSAGGIHFAMEYLQLNTSSLLNSQLQDNNFIDAKGMTLLSLVVEILETIASVPLCDMEREVSRTLSCFLNHQQREAETTRGRSGLGFSERTTDTAKSQPILVAIHASSASPPRILLSMRMAMSRA